MNEAAIIGVDLAKNVFQLHGAAADGSVVFRKGCPIRIMSIICPFSSCLPHNFFALRS